MTTSDHYALLGVARDATESSLKAAYYRQIRQYHPDTLMAALHHAEERDDAQAIRAAQQAIDAADDLTQQLNKAYDILSDVDKRRAYDLTLPTPKVESPRNPNPEPIYPKSKNEYRKTSNQNNTNLQWKRDPDGKELLQVIVIYGFIFVVIGMVLSSSPSFEPRSRWRATLKPNDPINLQNTAIAHATEKMVVSKTQYIEESTAQVIRGTQYATTLPLQQLLNAAHLEIQESDFNTAFDLYTQAIALDPMNSYIYFFRGQAAVNLGTVVMLKQAVEDFTRSIELRDNYLSVYSERANAHYLLWQITYDPTLPDLIRQDISDYRKNGGVVTQKMDIMLNFLP